MPLSHVLLTHAPDLDIELAPSVAKAGKAPKSACLDNGDCQGLIHHIY